MILPDGQVRIISFAPALLAAVRTGHKTVTRRRIAHAGLQASPAGYAFDGMHAGEAFFEAVPPGEVGGEHIRCPFGEAGEWLRIQEDPRLLLHIKGIRAEPVRDITEAEALAEGIVAYSLPAGDERGSDPQYGMAGEPAARPLQPSAVAAFHLLLNSFYPTAWERNEWVWVVDFQCHVLGPDNSNFSIVP